LYGNGRSHVRDLAANTPATYYLDTTTNEFVVGNPMQVEKMIELRVRPVEVPLGWTYRLDNPAPSLSARDTTIVSLTIEPDNRLLEDTEVRIAVEGYIDDEYIGGIMFTRRTPILSAALDSTMYLPLLTK
jgi:hypothetical protein